MRYPGFDLLVLWTLLAVVDDAGLRGGGGLGGCGRCIVFAFVFAFCFAFHFPFLLVLVIVLGCCACGCSISVPRGQTPVGRFVVAVVGSLGKECHFVKGFWESGMSCLLGPSPGCGICLLDDFIPSYIYVVGPCDWSVWY